GRTYFSLNRKALGILDFEKAIALCTQKIENNAKDAINYYYRGWALEKLDKKTEAMQDFDQSITLNPKHFASYFSRAYMNYNLENYEAAALDFKETLNLDPNNYYCCMMLAACYLETANLNLAIIYCTQSLSLKKSEIALYLKANILSNLEKYKEAQQSYEKTYELNSEIPGLKRQISFLRHYNRLDALPSVSKWQLQSLKFHIKRYQLEILAGKYFKRIKK
ncbi:MAG: tetratricopeptide repeat protein, partial [Bacteroidales bacterium]